MKKGTLLIVFMVTLLAAGMTAFAHHSFAATQTRARPSSRRQTRPVHVPESPFVRAHHGAR